MQWLILVVPALVIPLVSVIWAGRSQRALVERSRREHEQDRASRA